MKFSELKDKVIDWSKNNRAKKTTEGYETALRKFKRFLKTDPLLEDIRVKDAENFMDNISASDLTVDSINNYYRGLNRAFNLAVEWGLIEESPFKNLRQISGKASIPEHLNPNEMMGFLRSIEDLDFQLLLTAYFATGRARRELIHLKWEDIDFENKKFWTQRTVNGKKKENWINPFFSQILNVLHEKREDSEWLFPHWRDENEVTRKAKAEFKGADYPGLNLKSIQHSHKDMYETIGLDHLLADINEKYKRFSPGYYTPTNLDENSPSKIKIDISSIAKGKTFTKKDALKDLFMVDDDFDFIMDRLKFKKNVIIQGPPGVGKTYLAKRLAYFLMGVIDDDRVAMIQFHQSYSYEDFIQGFRPKKDGKFVLRSGIFYKFCDQARLDESKPWIFIIDEINRGNLSKIFGEMLMLIEADKRGPEFAVPLTYGKDGEEEENEEEESPTFYIPSNVYLIGTMNTADRSLAMVDYALRRRFSFIDLKPQFENPLFEEFLKSNNVQEELIEKIIKGMKAVNKTIAKDTKNLGPGYRIGHSYFCPTDKEQTYDENWYQMVIKSEIKPLLEEYWIEDSERAGKFVKRLLS